MADLNLNILLSGYHLLCSHSRLTLLHQTSKPTTSLALLLWWFLITFTVINLMVISVFHFLNLPAKINIFTFPSRNNFDLRGFHGTSFHCQHLLGKSENILFIFLISKHQGVAMRSPLISSLVISFGALAFCFLHIGIFWIYISCPEFSLISSFSHFIALLLSDRNLRI